MKKKQKILWTALPNGWTKDGQWLRLSVLVSPRLALDLDPGEKPPKLTLTDYPDWQDWPNRVLGASFKVQYAGLDLTPVERESEDPDPGLWQALFPATTPVRPFIFKDYSKRFVLSYPVGQVFDFLKDRYQKLALGVLDGLPGLDGPGPGTLEKLFGPLHRLERVPKALIAFVKNEYGGIQGPRAVPSQPYDPNADPGDTVAISNFELFRAFHTPSAAETTETDGKAVWKSYKQVELLAAGQFQYLLDFHQRVAAMNQYPRLMRRLGLVIDLRARVADLPSALPASVAWPWCPPGRPSHRMCSSRIRACR